jgi:hypothetical protein
MSIRRMLVVLAAVGLLSRVGWFEAVCSDERAAGPCSAVEEACRCPWPGLP